MAKMSKFNGSMKLALLAGLGYAIGLLATACDQPAPKCTTGRGPWTMVYTYKSGPDECKDTAIDIYGLQVYNASKSDGSEDMDKASVAIQADYLGAVAQYAASYEVVDPNPAHKWYALGAFTTPEAENDFCSIPSLSPAVQELPEVPAVEDDPDTEDDETVDGQPAMSLQYDWSNVKVYVSPSTLGTVLRGDVTVTLDGTACGYEAIGVYPSVYCGALVYDDFPDPNNPSVPLSCDGDPAACDDYGAECLGAVCKMPRDCTADPTVCDPDGAICSGGLCERADQKLCDAAPDPDHGYPYGSGISPDIPMMCDQNSMMCLPKGVPPQLQ
jgi:hypothetical protein